MEIYEFPKEKMKRRDRVLHQNTLEEVNSRMLRLIEIVNELMEKNKELEQEIKLNKQRLIKLAEFVSFSSES